jgi:hypothetical protein
MKSTYFTIHPGKNPPPKNGCRLKSGFLLKAPVLHFPNSTGLFTKPTGRHYTKYQFSPDIVRRRTRGEFVVLGREGVGDEVGMVGFS